MIIPIVVGTVNPLRTLAPDMNTGFSVNLERIRSFVDRQEFRRITEYQQHNDEINPVQCEDDEVMLTLKRC